MTASVILQRGGLAAISMACALAIGTAHADGPMLGQPISAEDLTPWDISVMPDGRGLPSGSGTAREGATVYAQKCAACHGENGAGGTASAVIAKGQITSINAAEKTIANFWPYATTLFDYIRRAMPWQQPKTLTSDETYALTAYLLMLNKLVGENDAMNATTLPQVKMPNRDGFIARFPELMGR